MSNLKLNKTRNWKDVIQAALPAGLELPMLKGQSDEPGVSETIESDEEQKYGEEDYSYIPIYAVPNAVTEALVGHSPAPSGYQAEKDIGEKAVKDDWQEYLASQEKLTKLILLLLLLFLVVPLLGRCRRRSKYCVLSRYCCTIFLVLAGMLMLLSLLFAILATVQLNRSLKKSVDCYAQFNSGKSKAYYVFKSEYNRRMYDPKYNQLLKRIIAQSDDTREEVQAEARTYRSRVLRNMQGAKPLLEDLRNELTVAKGLANRFQDALRAVKQNLKVFLTVQCNHKECGDFYRDNEIQMLDEGCLHYNRFPPTEELIKSIGDVLARNFVNYRQIGKPEEKPKEASGPVTALRGKLGPTWYRNTVGWLLLLLFLPLLLLIGLLVTLFSCKHGRRMLCAFLIAGIILFALNIILVLFFLVHGALAHQILCGEKGSKKSNDHISYQPRLRSGNVLQQSVSNESFIPKELNIKTYVEESLEKLEGAPILGSHPQAATVDQELLGGNPLSYNSSHFTWHMCQELVPEPKPGPLPGLISRLDNLTRIVGSSPFLLNQTNFLRAAHRELGQPLAAIIQRLWNKLRQLDHLLASGYGNFAGHMSSLLEKIKQSDKKVTDEVSRNISYFVDSAPKYGMESRSSKTRLKLDMDREVQFDDLCKRIANPMNAIWFWLLVFTLLIIPALCCANYLRSRLCCRRYVSQETLVSCGGENFVAHSTLPMELESHCHCYRYLPVCEETCCDYLEPNDCCEHHC